MTATPQLPVRLRTRHPAQQQIVREAKRFNVLQCGRRFGKTTLGVDLAIECALDGHPVGWFAPTYKYLDEAWRDILRATLDVRLVTDKQQHRIELVTGGSVECWTLDNDNPARGRKYKLAVIDEAGIVKDLESAWNEAIRPALTDVRGDAWFLGTPKGKNYFHTLYVRGQQGEPNWASWRFASIANPILSPDEIEEARAGMPEQAFRQEFLGEAVDDGTNPFGESFIRAHAVDELMPGPVVCYGLDLAKSVDYNVLIGLNAKGQCAQFDRWQGAWEATYARVTAQTGHLPVLLDSTGVGDPVLERFQKIGGQRFQGYKFSSLTKQQLMEGLAVAIQRPDSGLTYPKGVIVTELETFTYEYTRTGVRYTAPEGLHDDCVCALALAWEQYGRRPARSGFFASRASQSV